MKKTQLLVAVLALLFFACQQDREKITEKDESGNVIATYYKNKETGEKSGEYKAFYPSGKIQQIAYFKEGQLDGPSVEFYENGDTSILSNFLGGKFNGSYKTYYEGGKPWQSFTYNNNVIEGEFLNHKQDGSYEIVTFVNSVENGPFKEYYPDGTLMTEGSYIYGNPSIMIGQPDRALEHGELKKYDEKGEVYQIMMCDSSLCQTTWRRDTLPPN